MNAVFHQLKWDFRRIRGLWVVWILLLATSTFASLRWPGFNSMTQALAPVFFLAQQGTYYLFGFILMMRLMYNTPFTGTRSHWKTLPITRTALFWSKSLGILLLIFLPVLLTRLIGWWGQNMELPFIFWGSLHFGMIMLSLLVLGAIWASQCEYRGTAWLGSVGTVAVFAILMVIYNLVAERLPVLPLGARSGSSYSTSNASTGLTMAAICLIAVALAWFNGTRRRNPRAILFSLVGGISLAAGAGQLWKVDFLRTQPQKPAALAVDANVLAQDEFPSEDQQLLWNQVAVTLSSGHTVQPNRWQVHFEKDGQNLSNQFASSSFSDWLSHHQEQLRDFYPTATQLLLSSESDPKSCIRSNALNAGEGRLHGNARVSVYEWRLLASIPLDHGRPVALEGGGMIQVQAINGDRIRLYTVVPPEPFYQGSGFLGRLNRGYSQEIAHVLYHEESKTAVTTNTGSMNGMNSGSFSKRQSNFSVSLERRKDAWNLRTGLTSVEAGRKSLRLDIYEAINLGETAISWDRDNWKPYVERAREVDNTPGSKFVRPTITRTELGQNPTPAEVDAYLDGVLFSFPARPGREDWQNLEADLRAISPQHLDHLLARMPVGSYIDAIVLRVLRSQVTEAHKAAFLDALSRDPGLAGIATQRGWQLEAAPIMARLLRERRLLDTRAQASVIALVASREDPATFADLRWHFLNSTTNLRSIAEALEQCAGFPFEEALAQAWARVRYLPGGARQELSPLAIRLGDKEALRLTLLNYLSSENKETLRRIAEGVSGPSEASLPEWIRRHFADLAFDEENRKFILR